MSEISEKDNKTGRPTKYKTEYDKLAYKFCLLGATDADLATFFEVTETTINNWKIEHPLFFESIKKGREIADANVATRLYKRATGYTCKTTKFATYEGQITDEKEYEEHYPPDTTAAIFWLKNRQPHKWRDKREYSREDSGDISDETESVTKMILPGGKEIEV
ncbi:helix-turn-helix domain-containing protein [Proteiniphilum sp. X52]|uniref:helix-turn-helix domain-containing protein n=1 Tax=Proteiniphilum sp. X52 TaxID=2382159 RepID=UPI000F09D721|nr:helix-turn-helix domain-containing protein [Proteiniphilum sp. X52]RNC66457.1 helix-turn-helix domain-containing protein [Proteiniphilum sp. X52]